MKGSLGPLLNTSTENPVNVSLKTFLPSWLPKVPGLETFQEDQELSVCGPDSVALAAQLVTVQEGLSPSIPLQATPEMLSAVQQRKGYAVGRQIFNLSVLN